MATCAVKVNGKSPRICLICPLLPRTLTVLQLDQEQSSPYYPANGLVREPFGLEQRAMAHILDYLGYVTVGMMVVLSVVNIVVIADKMSHRSGLIERVVKRASFYIGVLRFGGGGARGFNERHHEG